MRLFHPQIAALVPARDSALADHARRFPDRDVYEDRELETITEIAIDPAAQVALVEQALSG